MVNTDKGTDRVYGFGLPAELLQRRLKCLQGLIASLTDLSSLQRTIECRNVFLYSIGGNG